MRNRQLEQHLTRPSVVREISPCVLRSPAMLCPRCTLECLPAMDARAVSSCPAWKLGGCREALDALHLLPRRAATAASSHLLCTPPSSTNPGTLPHRPSAPTVAQPLHRASASTRQSLLLFTWTQ